MSDLHSRRIVITRPPHKAQKFADQLRDLGAEPILLPTIEILPPEDTQPFDEALKNLSQYDCVAFTSANAVRHTWARLEAFEISPVMPIVAVVGTATQKSLREFDAQPDIMPAEHTAEALFEVMAQKLDLTGMKILLPQADIARPNLGKSLRDAGASVDEIVAYLTVKPKVDTDLLKQPFDAITFTSPSTVQNFCAMFVKPMNVIGNALVVCIGPVTAEAARDLNLPVHLVGNPHTVEGIINALLEHLGRKITV